KGYRNWLRDGAIIPYLSTRIREAWLKGLIPAAKELTNDILIPRVDWPAWGYIDAAKETKAAGQGISIGLTSPQREAAERGEDAFEILEENAKYLAKKQETYIKHGVSDFIATGVEQGEKNPTSQNSGNEDEELDTTLDNNGQPKGGQDD
ncbi:MAG: hypothetical protein LLG05_00465, partial [Porphyromonadaceae bacterium]|nr:hypothetical protein [Porphyromonadaceae bacterium]